MSKSEELEYDYVEKPNHYEIWEGLEVIDVIDKLLTPEEFIGYCKGNILKYQLRLGKKPGESVEREIGKIVVYQRIMKEFMKK